MQINIEEEKYQRVEPQRKGSKTYILKDKLKWYKIIKLSLYENYFMCEFNDKEELYEEIEKNLDEAKKLIKKKLFDKEN